MENTAWIIIRLKVTSHKVAYKTHCEHQSLLLLIYCIKVAFVLETFVLSYDALTKF